MKPMFRSQKQKDRTKYDRAREKQRYYRKPEML